jgi:hypothetical protein
VTMCLQSVLLKILSVITSIPWHKNKIFKTKLLIDCQGRSLLKSTRTMSCLYSCEYLHIVRATSC